MKLAIITNYWKNSDGGGIKTYLVNLVKEFKNRNIGVDVIFRFGSDFQNYHLICNKLMFSYKSYLKLKNLRPDVILSQGAWYCLLPGVMYKKHYGAKLIHTFHTEPDKKLPMLGKIFVQTLLNGCDCVTFVSKGLQIKIEEILRLKFKKTAVTYAGVRVQGTTEPEIREFKEKFDIKDNSIVLLALGLTALRYKAEGLKLLIKSVKKVGEKYPNIVLIATREGAHLEELRAFAEKEGVGENVIFTGDVDNPFVPLTICDIYTHISLGEGLPLALLEAMLVGKPIIATSVGGIPEAIENGINGILVQPDVDSIVEKIVCLLENQDIAQKLGENAKKTVKEKFTWKLSADKFLDLYYMEEAYR